MASEKTWYLNILYLSVEHLVTAETCHANQGLKKLRPTVLNDGIHCVGEEFLETLASYELILGVLLEMGSKIASQ